jgi:hypothetical protein
MSYYAKRHQEAAGKIATVMPERGFVCVFDHSKPDMYDSQTLWTLWLNLTSGESILTVVDARGGTSFFKLTPSTDITGGSDEAG